MIVRYRAHKHQLRAYLSKKKMISLMGGVGSGKTDGGSLWSVKRIRQMLPSQMGLIGANSYAQLRSSTLKNFYKNCKEWGVQLRPAAIPKTNGPFSIEAWNGSDWCEILCRSMDSYDFLAGIEINWAWLDETYGTSRDALEEVLARLRDERNGVKAQMLMTTTLDEPGSAQWEMVVRDYDPAMMEVIYATTYANARNLPDDYIDNLRSFYDERLFRRKVLCEWITLSKDQIYYNFNHDLHVSAMAEFQSDLPLNWMWDFNIGAGKPMSSALGQIIPGGAPNGMDTIQIFDELILDGADTDQMVKEFLQRPWQKRMAHPEEIYIFGDAAGKNKDTRSKTTDYGIIKDAGFTNQRIAKKNPGLRDRHNDTNLMLKNANGMSRVSVHPRCTVLIDGLANTSLVDSGQYKEKETYSQHITTALGYHISKEFSSAKRKAEQYRLRGT